MRDFSRSGLAFRKAAGQLYTGRAALNAVEWSGQKIGGVRSLGLLFQTKFAVRGFFAGLSLLALISAGHAAVAVAPPLVPVTVQLDWVTNAQFAGLVVAKEKGLYANAGLDVTLRAIDPVEMDAVAPVVRASKENWIGCADGTFLLKARSHGAPVKAFGTMLQASPIGIVKLAERGIHDLRGLAGKKIGLHAYNRPQLAIMLASAGLKGEDVHVVELGDDIDSLLTGKIDAQVCYLIDEPVAMERRGAKLRTFPGYLHGYVGYAQVYFASEQLIARDAALLKRFLTASNEGWRQALARPEETAATIVRSYLPGGDVAYQAESLRKIAGPLGAEAGLAGLSQMRRATWERSAHAAQVVPPSEVAALLGKLFGFHRVAGNLSRVVALTFLSLMNMSYRLFNQGWLRLSVILALALLCWWTPAEAATTPEAKAEARATIEKFLKCWETGDHATFAALLHPDLVFGYPGGRFNRDSLIKTFESYHQQKRDIKIYFGDKFVSDGKKSVLTYQFAATDKDSGKRFAVGTAVICEFKDGKIVAFREYWDTSVAEDQKAGELPLDEGKTTPWPISVWLRADTIN